MNRRLFIQQASLFTLTLASSKILSACNSNANDSSAALKEINFGVLSTESQDNQKPIWEPFAAAMSQEVGIPIKPFYVTQYAAVIEAMRFGKVQAAWLGGKSYIEAARVANAEAFAQVVSADGTRGYYSHLIANKDNPITAEAKAVGGDKYVIQNAAKLTFAFNEPNSTSGFLVPSYYIFTKNNIEPKKAFKRLIFAGNHEACALAVANKQVDVATVSNEALSRLERTNPTARQKIEIIWQSPLIPSDPIVYRQDLPADIKNRLQKFFYNYKDAKVLTPFEISGFVQAEDKNWHTIRELEIAKKIQETQAKENLSAQEKQQKIAELNQQLKEIQ
ncbi:phosphonate ABC transporter substrate-binding protein [Anabaena sp. FACHB-709]|uniref:ABC transporter phosphate-binding protein n=2 Tax=Nostocaceae TaxID=1162 RepID=A0A1Z4KFV9_ANAVA|nr:MULTISPECIES: phosphonate ABC transporter substrate-binding protein [Nostocaceae]BAY67852.1 ABC transporter phosphate-binding protein [Trichormus variabilis NIES-23]HBW29602.1 phosphonate ABC transporter substrate-binding protein [Nostoc sp. UBA8866]MBD2170056.1 phosphonate ABC transporter substrate-binding protein [Anabaena cylindrica FACHB-318]MBD2261523.1 phosphonate ABC transporter substrate-binding protein [Anabaena sp. FACHB-709]MBD2271107.1 phosphonate ABC transporter substrate-bindi